MLEELQSNSVIKAVIAQIRNNPPGVLQLQVLGLLCFTIQVLIKATYDSSLQIDRGLLEQLKDESGNQVTIHLGSGAFGCFSRAIPVAVNTFYSATGDEMKKEARVGDCYFT